MSCRYFVVFFTLLAFASLPIFANQEPEKYTFYQARDRIIAKIVGKNNVAITKKIGRGVGLLCIGTGLCLIIQYKRSLTH